MKGTLKTYNSEVVPLSDEGITDVDTVLTVTVYVLSTAMQS